MSLAEIRNGYTGRTRRLGGAFLLRPADAVEFIDECAAAGLRIEGVEGFAVTAGGAYQVRQEHSNDIADTTLSPAAFAEATKAFVSEPSRRDVWFEVVVS